jgi:hypothetical protein
MKKAMLVVLFVLFVQGCGGAVLPSVLYGLNTAQQILEYINDTLKPQNDAAQGQCAQVIMREKNATEYLTTAVAACDQLVDAWYAVEAVTELLQGKQRTDQSALIEKAKTRIADYNESYAEYEAKVR